jgi:hypothetical protein
MWCEGGGNKVCFREIIITGELSGQPGVVGRVWLSETGDYCRHQECKTSFVWEGGV